MCATKYVCQKLSQFRKLFYKQRSKTVSGAPLCQQPRNFVEAPDVPCRIAEDPSNHRASEKGSDATSSTFLNEMEPSMTKRMR